MQREVAVAGSSAQASAGSSNTEVLPGLPFFCVDVTPGL